MSLPIRSLPDVAARVAVALPPFGDGEALAAAFARSAGRAARDPFLTEIFSRTFAVLMPRPSSWISMMIWPPS